jgi:hypothetical protein
MMCHLTASPETQSHASKTETSETGSQNKSFLPEVVSVRYFVSVMRKANDIALKVQINLHDSIDAQTDT